MHPAPSLTQLPDGVLHAGLPTPFPVGDVNCWLMPEGTVTVVDPGMFEPTSLRRLEDLLASANLTCADVEAIVCTHAHPDHFGAAAWLAEQSGAPILTGRAEVRHMTRRGLEGSERELYLAMFDELGMPDEIRLGMPEAMQAIEPLVRRPLPEQITPIDDGDELELGGRRFRAQVTPGHAVGHLSLWNGETLFSGDHLLPKITPNPTLDLGDDGHRRKSLVEYLGSLDRFVAFDPDAVLPGHGHAFHGVPALVTELRAHHLERAEHIANVIADLGEPSAQDLSEVLFPDLAGFGVILGLSEIAGHLDLLLDDGTIRRLPGRPSRYTARAA